MLEWNSSFKIILIIHFRKKSIFFVLISAKTGDNCSAAFEKMAQRLLGEKFTENNTQNNANLNTNQSNNAAGGVRRSMQRRPTVTGTRNEFASRASVAQGI